jgi:hypothetical protein
MFHFTVNAQFAIVVTPRPPSGPLIQVAARHARRSRVSRRFVDMSRRGLGLLISLIILGAAMASAQNLPLDHPAIGYNAIPLSDPVTQLSRKIEQGKVQLAFDPVMGYLPAVLRALDIPMESQMAVFSKTSIQAMRIEPSNPRVLFFNDAVIAAWVRGGFVEFASHDPRLGMVFYRLDQSPLAYRERIAAGTTESPLVRRQDCLHCHMTFATLGVPGVLLRSVFPSPSGVPLDHVAKGHAAQYDTDSRMPFEKLWGGWYVTGNSGTAHHMGNLMAADEAHPESMLEGSPAHLDSLEGKCRADSRLTPYSDIVALMVFEHQVRAMNLITRAGWESRIALAGNRTLNQRARAAVKELADYLLFTGEAPLKGEIAGASGFAEAFASRGPRDSKGRSLRDLSLKGRLLRYPCSYMIYSEAFDALPTEARDAVYRRMWQTLSAMPAEDRRAIVEILRGTKPGLPGYFRS